MRATRSHFHHFFADRHCNFSLTFVQPHLLPMSQVVSITQAAAGDAELTLTYDINCQQHQEKSHLFQRQA